MSPSPSAATERHPIRVSRRLAWLFVPLALGRRNCRVDVVHRPTGDVLHARMGWAFRAQVPRPHVTAARRWTGRVWAWGVHGWRGRWLVNGSSHGIVVLSIDPPVRARVCGVPIRLRELAVSLEDPDRFLAAIGGAAEARPDEAPGNHEPGIHEPVDDEPVDEG
jgi:hypothetical protein